MLLTNPAAGAKVLLTWHVGERTTEASVPGGISEGCGPGFILGEAEAGEGDAEAVTLTTSACPVVVPAWDLFKGSHEMIHAKQWREQDGITCQLLIPVCLCVCVSDRLGHVAVCAFAKAEGPLKIF